jgi:hypothetical protein
VGLVGAMVAGVRFRSDARIRRAIDELPGTRIADVQRGERVRIEGAMHVGRAPLVAPFTGRACAFYRAIVLRRGQITVGVIELAREELGQDFFVTDASGRARVLGARAYVAVTPDTRLETGGLLDDAGPRLEDFLEKHGTTSRGVLLEKRLLFTEAVLLEGMTVAVIGVARHEPDPDGAGAAFDYRSPPTRVVLRADDDGALLVGGPR